MTEFEVIFQREDSKITRSFAISLDWKLSDYREEIQIHLGFPENPPCQFFLERTSEVLKDYLTFEQAGIREKDKLIIIPPTSSEQRGSSSSGSFTNRQEENQKSIPKSLLITYKLILNFISNNQSTKTSEYSIDLEEYYEDQPALFFKMESDKERQKFENALKAIASKEISSSEIDEILQEWCDDIALGYRYTIVEI